MHRERKADGDGRRGRRIDERAASRQLPAYHLWRREGRGCGAERESVKCSVRRTGNEADPATGQAGAASLGNRTRNGNTQEGAPGMNSTRDELLVRVSG